MSRQASSGRLGRLCGPLLAGSQRKLFLCVFLWTCACLLLLLRCGLIGRAPEVEPRLQSKRARSPAETSSSRPAPPEWPADLAEPSLHNDSGRAPEAAYLLVPSQAQSSSSLAPHVEPASSSAEPEPAGAHCNYRYPNLLDLQFNNIHWQRLSSSANGSASYYLYNAYYDDRWRGGAPSVRVLAMIDRVQVPPTNCLLWSANLRRPGHRLRPLVVRASFVYAWYPKWGNYKDGFLQPWIVTCPLPQAHLKLVPDSVSLVEAPAARRRRQVAPSEGQQPSTAPADYDCGGHAPPVTNNLPVYNQRPAAKRRFAVCVKGLDFPHEDVSVRLVEWIELLNLLGAGKIFLYTLDVHENISKVLHYYQKRGLVELSPLTLPGDQPNLPEYQHLYLKSKLTAKRQNELIPYNDCLYRNLNSYQYLALLDIDEIIMPLKHHSWHELMDEVEATSLLEQNYSRASYNVRNVYFFDDLAGPLGTTSAAAPPSGQSEPGGPAQSLELGIPHHLHMMQHVYRSRNYTKPGQYVKCFHNTDRVVSLHNHFPMNCFGQCTTYSVPVHLAHLQHYRKDCVGPLKQSCKSDFRVFTTRDTTIWKYKQQMIRRTTRVLNQLGLLSPAEPNR